MNDKLFRGIDKDPLETVRHAKSECHAWHAANRKEERSTLTHPTSHTNIEICLTDGSWKHDALLSGYRWTWKNAEGGIQLMGARNQDKTISPLHSELEALS